MTPRPSNTHNEGGIHTLVVFALIAIVTLAILATFYPWSSDSGDKHNGQTSSISVTPEATPTEDPLPPSLRLELALPASLSDIQYHFAKAAQIIPYCPLCYGIDRPQIKFTPSEEAVFVSLLFTESNLNPYDEWGNLKVSTAGCVGIAQLCGDLLTFDTRDNQFLAIYTAADYFKQLLVEEGGDFTAALRRYKGITTEDTTWQADTVYKYIKLRS